MFGTNDIIYVPEDGRLIFDDVYRWQRFTIDVRNMGLRIRPGAFEHLSEQVRSALTLVKASPRFKDRVARISANTDELLRDLAKLSGAAREAIPASIAEEFGNAESNWWARITDLPAESFYEDDYEREVRSPVNAIPHETFGSVTISQLDGLEVPLAEKDEEEGLPFSLDVPGDGITAQPIPLNEPLPLVREFCGAGGASAHGRTVNITTKADVANEHQICTPLGRIGKQLFATIYMQHTIDTRAEVLGRLPGSALDIAIKLLETSKFTLLHDGHTHRIYERSGDVIHLYSGLEGKESEGVETIPAFMLVAAAGGETDPMNRGALYESIREALKG